MKKNLILFTAMKFKSMSSQWTITSTHYLLLLLHSELVSQKPVNKKFIYQLKLECLVVKENSFGSIYDIRMISVSVHT